jgi:hypothetical protein
MIHVSRNFAKISSREPEELFAELKRHNVHKVAIAYAVVAWLLMQVAKPTTL